MGILATGALPSGVQLSNVYISFSDESIYVRPNDMNGTIEYTSCYRVFANPSREGGHICRVPFQVAIPVEQDTKRAYDVIYEHLKSLWPNSSDFLEKKPTFLDTIISGMVVPPPIEPVSTESPSSLQ
jgi:hypothetical protein